MRGVEVSHVAGDSGPLPAAPNTRDCAVERARRESRDRGRELSTRTKIRQGPRYTCALETERGAVTPLPPKTRENTPNTNLPLFCTKS